MENNSYFEKKNYDMKGIVVVGGVGHGYSHKWWMITSDHKVDAKEAGLIASKLDGGYLFGSRLEIIHEFDGKEGRYKVVGYID